jgi:hypothetical protein
VSRVERNLRIAEVQLHAQRHQETPRAADEKVG